MKKDIFKIGFLFSLIIVIFSQAALAEIGCCSNPFSNTLVCSFERMVDKDTECCPPKEEYSNYYYSSSQPFGPTDEEDCKTNYFYSNKACEYVDSCSNGCCCKTLGNHEVTTKAECVGSGVTSFQAGETDCSAVCQAAPQCNDNIDNDGDGCMDYPDDLGCDSTSDDDESGGTCNAFGGNCEKISYKPKIENLQVIAVKGEKKFKISWIDECPQNAQYYEIKRCEGEDCSDFVSVRTVKEQNYVDDYEGLLFEREYTYMVQGFYNVQKESEIAQKKGDLGDLECWKKTDNNPFCIHYTYYRKYKDYLVNHHSFSFNNFDQNVKSVFSSKLNTAYSCTNINKLVKQDPPGKCTDDKMCVIEDNAPKCVSIPQCNVDSANPFGMYYTLNNCEAKEYCFYDRSFTIVDSCFSCSAGMDCYDYKSKESCEKDRCNVNNCEWKGLSDEFDTGICITKDVDNCDWCDKTGTSEAQTSSSANKIFSGCSEEKAAVLSTQEDICYYTSGIAKNCENVICTDLKEEDCSSTNIILDSNNKPINNLINPCGINVCQLFEGKCKKNANGDIYADCLDSKCEQDVFAPKTAFDAVIQRGVYESIKINIFDKISSKTGESLKTDSSYVTYLSTDKNEKHKFSKKTNSKELIISGLNLFDSKTGEKILVFSEGNNLLRYYSEDPNKNIGLVNSIAIEAYSNNSRPRIFSVTVEGANEVGETHYTTNLKPSVIVKFYEDAYITQARLVNNKNSAPYTPSFANSFSKEFIFDFSEQMPEGNYSFEINAKNENNKYLEETESINIIIDNNINNMEITPSKGEVVNSSNVEIKITFKEQVEIDELEINNVSYLEHFKSSDKTTYSASLDLSDGKKDIILKVKDNAGNTLTADSYFVVDAKEELVISVREPSFGIASEYTFDLVVESDNSAECKYYFSGTNANSNMDYSAMDSFDSSDGYYHKVNSFNQIPSGSSSKYYLQVKCIDKRFGKFTNTSLELMVDSTPPKIKSYYAFPNPIAEEPVETFLNVQLDEDSICRYSESETQFDLMDGRFTNVYKTSHRTNLTNLPKDGSRTYHVACRNKAELVSETKTVTVNINLNTPLTITSRTPGTSNTTNIKLILETNKKAQCKYSATDSSVNSGYIFGPVDYKHEKVLYLSQGRYDYYVKCKDVYKDEWSAAQKISFAIDTTAPEMIYINDSSELKNPEVTWMTDKLRVKWLAEDNDTDIHYYKYQITETGTLRVVKNWSTSTKEDRWFWIDDLELKDNREYYFKTKARNIVGFESSEMESDGIKIDISQKPADCSNKVKDITETDIDCGGECGPCPEGAKCLVDSDCVNNYCDETSKRCQKPKCDDGAENGEETDIDCGGKTCNKCSDGLKCILNSDCQSNNCEAGYCKSNACSNGIQDGLESDIDCGGACPVKCSEGKNCNEDNDCSGDGKCISGKCKICPFDDQDCDGIKDSDKDGDGIDDQWELDNGLDPSDSSDGSKDSDGDGLTNLEEYHYKTDPRKADTDGDKYSDYDEVNKYSTDPLEASSKPKSNILWILIIMIGGVISGIIVFAVYQKTSQESKKPKEPMGLKSAISQNQMPRRMPASRPPQKRGPTPEEIRIAKLRELQNKRREEKKKEHEKAFSNFGEKKEEPKTEIPIKKLENSQIKQEQNNKPQEKVQQKSESAFDRLSKIAGEKKLQSKGSSTEKSEDKKDTFDKLSEAAAVNKKTTIVSNSKKKRKTAKKKKKKAKK